MLVPKEKLGSGKALRWEKFNPQIFKIQDMFRRNKKIWMKKICLKKNLGSYFWSKNILNQKEFGIKKGWVKICWSKTYWLYKIPKLKKTRIGSLVSNSSLVLDNDHSTVGRWPSWAWCLTFLGMVVDHPLANVAPCLDGGWPSFRWWVTIVGMVGEHPWHMSPVFSFVS